MDKARLQQLKMRQLALLLALQEHGTMHRASAALNMTQSTASKMLADLEDLLDASLFDRLARGMVPTSLGHAALDFAGGQMARAERFLEDFEVRRDGGFGVLTVGAIMGAAPNLVASAVAEIKRRRPKLIVRLLGETSDNILDMLEAGRLDLAVGRFASPRHASLFDFEPLAEEALVLVARCGHELVDEFSGDLQRLAGQPWIVQPSTTPARQVMDQAFARAGIEFPDNVVECMSIFAILNLVQTSDAFAILPASVTEAYLKAGLLVRLPMRPAISVEGFGIVSRRNEVLTPLALEFAEELRQHAMALRSQQEAG